MTAPLTDVQKGLAAISSLAILASSLPTTDVRAALERERDRALKTDRAHSQSIGIMLDIVDAVAFLGRLGGDLEHAAEQNRRPGGGA